MFNPKYTAHETVHENMILVKAKGFLGDTEMCLPMTLKQFNVGMKKYDKGEHIKDAFPHLSKTCQEFLISGMDEKMQKEFFD
jgi:hypothetical protein